MTEPTSPERKPRSRRRTAALLLAGGAVVTASGTASAEPVLSGSMGFAERGDLVLGTRSGTPHVGDVILFAPPAPYRTPGGRPVMHRVHPVSTP